jgi:hypothetical protein
VDVSVRRLFGQEAGGVFVLGDPRLGAVLRALRMERGLTRDVVAGLVPCAPSLVSQVESGARALLPWLAGRLDQVYGSGATISVLTGPGGYHWGQGCANLEADDRVVLVRLPKGEVMVPVSRRALLTGLGVGAMSGVLVDIGSASAGVPADEELLADLTGSLASLQAAGRVLPPGRLIDPLIGQVGLLDVMRRRAPALLRRDFLMLQAQYAEYLSWMVQEAGDPAGSVQWVDRTRQWADQADWPAMVAYTHVRRSVVASTCVGDGSAAVEHAARALRVVGAPAAVRAQAVKQMAYGHALTGYSEGCKAALEQTYRLLGSASAAGELANQPIGRRIVDIESALSQYRGTCDVYLGGADKAIPFLESSQVAYGTAHGSRSRHYAVSNARLGRAYAQSGDPDRACELALEAADSAAVVDSLTTRTELQRILPLLGRWPGREDVAEVRHRINALA